MHPKEDIEVTDADQKKINSFATWHLKYKEYSSVLEQKKKELANLNDAEDELIVLDETSHPMMIGETFFHLPTDEVSDELVAVKDRLKLRMVELEEKITHCKTHMTTLKKDLYSKFGSHINLEED